MSHRNENPKLLDMIRNVLRRLDRLERAQTTRQNDLRIGDIVLSTDTATGRIIMTNLVTESAKYLGDPDDVEFSYSGTLVYDVEDEGINSPPYVMPQNSVVREVVLSMNNTTTDNVSVYLITGDATHYFTATLPEGSKMHVNPCNIPVKKNTRMWVQLQDLGDADGDAHDLTVIVRFGAETTATRTDSEI
jgi:hypothetical protein